MARESLNTPAKICAVALIIGGGSNLLGRLVQTDWLINPIAGDPALSPVSAACFLMFGLALWRLQMAGAKPWEPLAIGTLVIAFTAANLLESPAHGIAVSLSTNMTFACLSCALLCISFKNEGVRRYTHVFAVVGTLAALLSLLVYTYGLEELKNFGLNFGFRLEGVALSLLASIGLICVRPHDGFLRLLSSQTTAGTMVRRLLPVVVLIPLLGLVTGAEQHTENDLILSLLLLLCGTPILILTVGYRLEKSELQREESYQGLQKLTVKLNQQLDELHASEEKLREALKIRSQLIANINHELRTPLQGILGTVQLLLARPLAQQDHDLVFVAGQSANHLSQLVNNMLTFADIEHAQLTVNPQPLDPREVVVSCVRSLDWVAEKKGLKLSVSIKEPMPESIVSDAILIERALHELIDNAIKFTDKGEVSLSVKLTANEGRSQLRLVVEDTGPGMNFDELGQPFAQADSSFKRKHGGLGLGLILVRKMVAILDGKMEVESAPGAGTRVTVDLPVVSLSATKIESEKKEAHEPGRQEQLAQKRILVAEDNPVNAKLMQMLLRKIGMQSDLVRDGQEAVRAVETGQYALVLMDVQMPVMDGLEATGEIRRLAPNHSGIPIVAVTAHASDEDSRVCLGAGMNDFITKPVNLDKLEQLIKKWLLTSTATAEHEVA